MVFRQEMKEIFGGHEGLPNDWTCPETETERKEAGVLSQTRRPDPET